MSCTPSSMTSESTTISKNSIGYILSETDFFNFCTIADCKHKMMITFMKIDDETIMKIVQIPSIYDLNENINNKKFLKALGKEYTDYYKNACSLYSFNAYIGALIYLRRIFEKLLIDTFDNNIGKMKMTFDDFKKERMENKIKILKDYLPTIMFSSDFNNIYTKISDCIHNLNEDECSKMFLDIEMGI